MINGLQLVLAAALPVLAACGSSSQGAGTAPRPYANVITSSELREAEARNLYEAIERLRPRWLVVRSGMRSFNVETQVVVFEDQAFLGDQDQLRSLGIEGIFEVRYVDGPTAQAMLPGIADRHVQGAIIIHRTPPPD